MSRLLVKYQLIGELFDDLFKQEDEEAGARVADFFCWNYPQIRMPDKGSVGLMLEEMRTVVPIYAEDLCKTHWSDMPR